MKQLSWPAIVAAVLAAAAIAAALLLPAEDTDIVIALGSGAIAAAVLALKD